MKTFPLFTLLLCASCTSATLNDEELIKVLAVAKEPGAGFESLRFGAPENAFSGLGERSDNGIDGISFAHLADTVAYGIVPVKAPVYVFSNGKFSQVGFSATGFSNGNKLQGCLEQLYGPLERKGINDYRGSRGKAVLWLTRGYDGSATVTLVNRTEINL